MRNAMIIKLLNGRHYEGSPIRGREDCGLPVVPFYDESGIICKYMVVRYELGANREVASYLFEADAIKRAKGDFEWETKGKK